MNVRIKTVTLAVVTIVLAAATVNDCAWAKKHKKSDENILNSQTSMEIFPIQRGYDGAQFIVTKAGYLVSLPGLGIAPDATQIAAYRDEQNNTWYIDRDGIPVKLTPEQIQWGMAQINQQAAQQQSQMQQPVNQGSSGVGSALGTGLAVAGGMVAGAALSGAMYNNNYYGIPYGVPVYHNGGRYYYNGGNGNRVYINNSNNKYINQWNHQTNWKNNKPTTLPSYGHPATIPAHGHTPQLPSYGHPGTIPGHGYTRPTQLPSNHHGSLAGARPAQLPSNHHGSVSGHGFAANQSVHHSISGGGAHAAHAAHGARGGGGRRR